jgi:gluconolactonase
MIRLTLLKRLILPLLILIAGSIITDVAFTHSNPCSGCESYYDTIDSEGGYSFQPDGSYFYSDVAGTHQGFLNGPVAHDFDIYLWYWSGTEWQLKARGDSNTSDEHVSYDGPAGYYIWMVVSFSGSGGFDFFMKRPASTTPLPDPQTLQDVIASGAKVEKLAGNLVFTEGPVWHTDGYLLFTDLGQGKILKWEAEKGLTTFRQPSQGANGLAFDNNGLLLACEHTTRRVTRTESNGNITVVASSFEGKRLNSPNDLAIGSDNSIYFTDPPYGLANPSLSELKFNGVFRIAPDGKISLLAKDFDRPNGITFSPDKKSLYVADTTKNHIRIFDVSEDGGISNGRVFVPVVRNPDGIKTDELGNLYVACNDGVAVYTSKGKHLGNIAVPEAPANCGFGDSDFKSLYITARQGLYRIRLAFAGAR